MFCRVCKKSKVKNLAISYFLSLDIKVSGMFSILISNGPTSNLS